MSVVLPVPGPPVITSSLADSACRTASRCEAESRSRWRRSKRPNWCCQSAPGSSTGCASRRLAAAATPFSADRIRGV